ncbi:amidase [Zavarzinia sp. CC-PAN008]|uniref:amidase n=1 Tax=Zavarzinia sp. CC-PAN008 TaxID=3243332 RepID=UPI003F74A180
MAGSDLAFRSAGDLAHDLADGRLSAADAVEASIARIEAGDGEVNAVVVRDFARARAAAAEADKALAQGVRKPLLGVPITVKESYGLAGTPTTWGFPEMAGWQPDGDSIAVARLKAAGAIVVGKTNVPVALADWQSYNPIYGVTRNPWNLGRSPGGSSGGSAAALAAGFSHLEIGSDIGGSIRVPAHYCGVYGHKPTWGIMPLRGHGLAGFEQEPDLAVGGPMARTASDLALALDILAGPEEMFATGWKLDLAPPRQQRLADYRVLVLDSHPSSPTDHEVQAAVHRVAEALNRAGARVATTSNRLPDLARAHVLYERLLWGFMAAGFPPEQLAAVRAQVAGLAPDDASLDAVRARAMVQDHGTWLGANNERWALMRAWSALFEEWDAVICPPAGTAAFPHDHSATLTTRTLQVNGRTERYADATLTWAGVATLPGLPGTAIPAGRTADGMPVGVQIIGPFGGDRTTLKLAELLEHDMGGFVPPPAFA